MFQESNKVKILKDRSKMLKKVRSFFEKKNVLEVDPAYILKHPSIDEHIDSIKTYPYNNTECYLHTSPEYLMKRLLAMGMKDIYFLGHVFRQNEIGTKHNIEFTMIEWYRSKISETQFLKETIDLIGLFIDFKKVVKVSFFDLFLKNYNLDIFKSKKEDFLKKLNETGFDFSKDEKLSKDTLINLLFDFAMENLLEKNVLYLVKNFPPLQTPLAKTQVTKNGVFSKRFEFYFNGYELANGYDELTDSKLLLKRFNKIIKNKKNLTLDNKLIEALPFIGNCFGIAVGFDRLFMLKHKLSEIKDAICFSFLEL
ncbi:MAG: EF-P lysine aminoacylase GenX [Parachlamydiales bacterium]|nr:EF-P lysine aminoacylase GenX [Parachlamydiales bacterium]